MSCRPITCINKQDALADSLDKQDHMAVDRVITMRPYYGACHLKIQTKFAKYFRPLPHKFRGALSSNHNIWKHSLRAGELAFVMSGNFCEILYV